MSETSGIPSGLIPWGKPYLGKRERTYVAQALNSTWISGGEFVDRFESELASLIGTKYAATTSNGTTALHLSLVAAGIGPGDEVIVPGFTFVAAANVTIQTGAKPVFTAIDPETWCIDPASIQKNINKKTKAIIPVHIYGNVCDMDPIQSIAREHNIYLIEDAAESIFSSYKGKFTGSFGDLGCFSFQATKTITMGEGGAVLTDNSELYQRMKELRSHGMRENRRYWHDMVGYNYRLTNLQAAMGCAQLEKYKWIINQKKRIYRRYQKNLSDVPGINFQRITDGAEPVIWTVALLINPGYFTGDRDYIMSEMLQKGIETRPGFYPFSVMPLYQAPHNDVTDSIASHVICLPSYTSISNKTIDYICEQLVNCRK
jgi:perosamine synthetase